MKDFSYITNSSPAFVENLYRDFLQNPDSVDPELKKFFEGFDFAINSNAPVNGNGKTAQPADEIEKNQTSGGVDWMKEIRAYRMILEQGR